MCVCVALLGGGGLFMSEKFVGWGTIVCCLFAVYTYRNYNFQTMVLKYELMEVKL